MAEKKQESIEVNNSTHILVNHFLSESVLIYGICLCISSQIQINLAVVMTRFTSMLRGG